MSRRTSTGSSVLALVVSMAFACAPDPASQAPSQSAAPGLQSWNEGGAKQQILDFVAQVADPRSPDFVPEAERIAVFDHDGTLWAEQPAYFQLLFAIDRVKALTSEHPEWASQQPFQAVIEGDMEAPAAAGHHGLLELVMATHAGMTSAGDGARLGVLIHHTDAEREWAYDRDSHIGRLVRGLDEAADRRWVVVDMKQDWKAVYPSR
jgi:hypothetical protein